jgi:hypothetical protein
VKAVELFKIRIMEPVLRIDTAGVSAMSGRWRALSSDLVNGIGPPGGLGLSCQASAAAVHAGHAQVTAGTAALEARLLAAAARVDTADARYTANEVDSAATLAAVVAV